MKLKNFDVAKSSNYYRSLNNVLTEDFGMLIAGKTRCGKTNTLMNILRLPLVLYDKIYFYTPNHHQEKIQDLQKLMKEASEEVGYDVLEILGEDEIKNTTDYSSNDRKVVVFDDLMNAPQAVQN